MCLYAAGQAIVAAKKIRQKPGSILAWKILRRTYNGLESPYFSKAFWKAGVNRSDRRSAKLTMAEEAALGWAYYEAQIDHGIHVFLNKEDAKWNAGYSSELVVVEVECKNADLVARNSKRSNTRQAVYTKVTLSKKEFDRAMKG